MLWMAEWKQSDVLAFGLCPFLFRPDVVTMELVLFHISKETLCFLATLPMVRPWRDIRDLIALPSSLPVASKWMGIGTPELCGLINADGGSPLKVSLILIYADLFSDSVSPHLEWNSTLPKHIKSFSGLTKKVQFHLSIGVRKNISFPCNRWKRSSEENHRWRWLLWRFPCGTWRTWWHKAIK